MLQQQTSQIRGIPTQEIHQSEVAPHHLCKLFVINGDTIALPCVQIRHQRTQFTDLVRETRSPGGSFLKGVLILSLRGASLARENLKDRHSPHLFKVILKALWEGLQEFAALQSPSSLLGELALSYHFVLRIQLQNTIHGSLLEFLFARLPKLLVEPLQAPSIVPGLVVSSVEGLASLPQTSHTLVGHALVGQDHGGVGTSGEVIGTELQGSPLGSQRVKRP
jgi:hypothetical protein